jgi:hypothetical protein
MICSTPAADAGVSQKRPTIRLVGSASTIPATADKTQITRIFTNLAAVTGRARQSAACALRRARRLIGLSHSPSGGHRSAPPYLLARSDARWPQIYSFRKGLMRMLKSSITLKWPAQSPRQASRAATRSATDFEDVCEMRKSTTSLDAFAPRRKTRSPKSTHVRAAR